MTTAAAPQLEAADPRRWVTLAIVVVAVVIIVLDTTVLNVAIPTILHDFHTQLPALQWVVTGYSLTFATLLIIGGRLGDIYGHRRTFMVGAGLFGVGSLVASVSTSVPTLVLGEALIEGIGASLMMPATLAILSTTFSGRERATAFAAWGAVAGAAGAFGPVVGGFLTTNYSWRWSFRINVIVAPLAMLGALVFMPRARRSDGPKRLDAPGAALVATGMFLAVFALSEGGTYGWASPVKDLSVAGRLVWPATRPVSAIPVILVAAVAVLAGFYLVERSRERRGAGPLFEFGQLRHKGFRYGLITTTVLAMGQFGLIFVLPVFLQDGRHLSAARNGLWQLPSGLFIIAGAQLGGYLTRRVGIVTVVRTGLLLESAGIAYIAFSISTGLTFIRLLPGFAFYGFGIGFATSQLTNVILSDIRPDKAGVASGANTTVRQIGSALGVAVIGSILTAQTIRHAVAAITASRLAPAGRRAALAAVRINGVGYRPPAGTARGDVAILDHALGSAVASGARPALLFAAAVVLLGAGLSWLIPSVDVAPPAVASGAARPEAAHPRAAGSPERSERRRTV